MTLMASSSGGEITPVPGCETHTRFHGNEEVPLVGQRQLAELVCREYAATRSSAAPTVLAAMYAYRDWCIQQVAASSEPTSQQGIDRAAVSPRPYSTFGEYVMEPMSEVCGLYAPERERLNAAIPVLRGIFFSWMADTSEIAGDKAYTDASIETWLSLGNA